MIALKGGLKRAVVIGPLLIALGCSGGPEEMAADPGHGSVTRSYVRFLDLTDAGAKATIGPRELLTANLTAGEGPFERTGVRPESVLVKSGNDSKTVKVSFKAEVPASIIARTRNGKLEAIVVENEPRTAEQTSSLISVVNVSGTPVQVTAPPIGAIADGTVSGQAKVDASNLSFAGKAGNAPIRLAAPANLEAGNAYSVVIERRNGKYEAFVLRNTSKMIILAPSGSSPSN